MKINITNAQELEISGYKNINVLDKAAISSIKDIPSYSCNEIIVNQGINFLGYQEAVTLIVDCLQKLSLDGIINISLLNLESSLSDGYTQESINTLLPMANCFIATSLLVGIFNEQGVQVVSIQSSEGLLNIVGKKVDS